LPFRRTNATSAPSNDRSVRTVHYAVNNLMQSDIHGCRESVITAEARKRREKIRTCEANNGLIAGDFVPFRHCQAKVDRTYLDVESPRQVACTLGQAESYSATGSLRIRRISHLSRRGSSEIVQAEIRRAPR
jgi:hypothetical protein